MYKPEIDPEEEALLRLYCLKHHVESVTASIARLWSPYFANHGSPFDLAVLTFVTEAAPVGLAAVLDELEYDLGPVCPWHDVRALLPAWNRTQAAFCAAQDEFYSQRVKLLPYRQANANQDWIDEDTFLVQYLSETRLEAVSTSRSQSCA